MVSNAFNISNVAMNASSANLNISAFSSNLSVNGYVISHNVQVSNAIIFGDGSQLTSASGGQMLFDYTGNGSQTTFSTGNYYATSLLNTNVYMGGLYQRKSQYSWVGTNIIFNNPPPNQVNVEIIVTTLYNPINVPSPLSVYPSTLSTGGPSWDTSGNLTVIGNVYAQSYQLATVGPVSGTGMFLTSPTTLTLGTAGTSQLSLNSLGSLSFNSANAQILASSTDSASNPGYSWAGNPSTGMFRPAGSTLGFSTAATEHMRIDPNGNVGIGTTAPISPLTVQGNVNINNGGIFQNGVVVPNLITVMTYNLAL